MKAETGSEFGLGAAEGADLPEKILERAAHDGADGAHVDQVHAARFAREGRDQIGARADEREVRLRGAERDDGGGFCGEPRVARGELGKVVGRDTDEAGGIAPRALL